MKARLVFTRAVLFTLFANKLQSNAAVKALQLLQKFLANRVVAKMFQFGGRGFDARQALGFVSLVFSFTPCYPFFSYWSSSFISVKNDWS